MSIIWVPSERILEAIEQIAQKDRDLDPLDPKFAGICDEANRVGVSTLKNVLRAKQYSDSQIEAWDDRGRYSLSQAIFEVLLRAPALVNYNFTIINAYNKVKELTELGSIAIGGAAVVPGPSDVGGIGFGRLDAVDGCLPAFFPRRRNY